MEPVVLPVLTIPVATLVVSKLGQVIIKVVDLIPLLKVPAAPVATTQALVLTGARLCPLDIKLPIPVVLLILVMLVSTNPVEIVIFVLAATPAQVVTEAL